MRPRVVLYTLLVFVSCAYSDLSVYAACGSIYEGISAIYPFMLLAVLYTFMHFLICANWSVYAACGGMFESLSADLPVLLLAVVYFFIYFVTRADWSAYAACGGIFEGVPADLPVHAACGSMIVYILCPIRLCVPLYLFAPFADSVAAKAYPRRQLSLLIWSAVTTTSKTSGPSLLVYQQERQLAQSSPPLSLRRLPFEAVSEALTENLQLLDLFSIACWVQRDLSLLLRVLIRVDARPLLSILRWVLSRVILTASHINILYSHSATCSISILSIPMGDLARVFSSSHALSMHLSAFHI